ncbi:MAG: hypothetical protein P8X70_00525 [Nanoarchaeota archaeon]
MTNETQTGMNKKNILLNERIKLSIEMDSLLKDIKILGKQIIKEIKEQGKADDKSKNRQIELLSKFKLCGSRLMEIYEELNDDK